MLALMTTPPLTALLADRESGGVGGGAGIESAASWSMLASVGAGSARPRGAILLHESGGSTRCRDHRRGNSTGRVDVRACRVRPFS